MLTERKKRFGDEYIRTGNATQSAISAGYSEKTAYSSGQRLLKDVDVKKYIDEQMGAIHSDKIASAEEVLAYLTSVLRGESRSHEIVVEGIGGGVSEARVVTKPPSEKDRLKSAELIGKRYGIYVDKQNLAVTTPVVLKDDFDDE